MPDARLVCAALRTGALTLGFDTLITQALVALVQGRLGHAPRIPTRTGAYVISPTTACGGGLSQASMIQGNDCSVRLAAPCACAPTRRRVAPREDVWPEEARH